MRNRHGTALGYLFSEKRNDRTIGAQHVSEPHRHEFRILAVAADCLNNHFADTLGRPHDIRRIHRLIGGNLNERLRAEFVRTASYVQRPEHVIFYSFVGAGFHQGDMFMRRRVKHDLRAISFKQIPHLSLIPHAAD